MILYKIFKCARCARALEISQDAYDLSVHRDRVRCNRTSRFLLRLLPAHRSTARTYIIVVYYNMLAGCILYNYIYNIGTGRDGRV